eukprot:766603-Hanusia_phi.AAC.6
MSCLDHHKHGSTNLSLDLRSHTKVQVAREAAGQDYLPKNERKGIVITEEDEDEGEMVRGSDDGGGRKGAGAGAGR